MRLAREAADGGGELTDSGHSEPVDRGVSEGCQILRRIPAEDCTTILIQRRIADVVDAVFDGTPVTSDKFQKFRRGGAMTWDRRDVVGRFGLGAAIPSAVSHDSTDLIDTGPV